MTELPFGWTRASLGELGRWVGGGTPSTSVAEYWDGDIPWVSPKDMKVERLADAEDHVSAAAIEESSTNLVPDGAVLVVTRSGILRHTLPVAVTERAVALNQDLKALVPAGGVEASYVAWAIRASATAILRECSKAGTTVSNIETSRLLAFAIPVAPLAEQRRIVRAIEEHLSRLEAACGSLTRVQRRLERWRFATLAALTQHPAPRCRIGDVARVGSGATPKRDRREYWTGGDVPWVMSGQLTRPFVTEPAALITQKALRETSCRVWPKGTLLVALYGEGKTRGHCSELLIDAATNQACAAIQIHDSDIDRDFVKLYFNASYQANRSLSAGGVQPNLSLGLIKDMTFPCPPVTEQRAIVARIEEDLAHADHLGLAVAEALAESAGLRGSILARAFRGELVPQDPNDEPANLLLDRIAAARAARPAPGRKRRVRTPA